MASPSLDSLLEKGDEYAAFDWNRSDVQREYLLSQYTFNLMSGGFGTGKTTALCNKAILLSMIPGNLGYLGRFDGKALKQTTMQVLVDMLPKGSYSKNDQAGLLTFSPELGGSKIVYGDFKDLNDLKNHPLGWFGIDQVEECPEEVWSYLAGRLRRRIPILHEGRRQYRVVGQCPKGNGGRHHALYGTTRCLRCNESLPPYDDKPVSADVVAPWDLIIYNRYGTGVANPEDPTHWIFRYFPGLPSYHGTSGPGKEGYMAYHGTIYDGLRAGFVDSKYVKTLEKQYSKNKVMFDRYLLGIWVHAEGLVYPGWSRKDNYLDAWSVRHDGTPLVPQERGAYEYIDHGLTSPTAVGWVVPMECECGCGKTDYFIVAEHYLGGRGTHYHSQCIKTIRGQLDRPILATYLDSAAFAKMQTRSSKELAANPNLDELYSYADQYIEEGIFVLPNQKDWDAGYDHITTLLEVDENHVHPVTGRKGAPHLYVLNTCPNFRNEIETYKWKKVKGANDHKEEPVDKDDHHMDGINGFFTSRPVMVNTAPPAKDPDEWLLKQLDELDIQGSGHMSA